MRRMFGMGLALTLVVGLGVAALNAAAPPTKDAPKADSKSTAKEPGKGARILFVTQSGTFKHGSVTRQGEKLSPAERAMEELAASSGLFRVTCTQDIAKDFTKENLQNYDIVMFYTTGPRDKLPFKEEDLTYFLNDWLKQKGHGFLGTHSAADTLNDYKPYYDMIGGTFDGHPWQEGETVTVSVHDPNNAITKPWGGDEFVIKDEIYKFKNWAPQNVRVLMSLDMSKTNLKQPYHVPVAWIREYGEGKVMHMSLGHRPDVWTNPKYRESLLGGIKWILGQEKIDATPNPDLSKAQDEKAKADVSAKKG